MANALQRFIQCHKYWVCRGCGLSALHGTGAPTSAGGNWSIPAARMAGNCCSGPARSVSLGYAASPSRSGDSVAASLLGGDDDVAVSARVNGLARGERWLFAVADAAGKDTGIQGELAWVVLAKGQRGSSRRRPMPWPTSVTSTTP